MRANRSVLWALLLIGIGVVLLLRNSGAIDEDVRIWPMVLLGIGVLLLLDHLLFERGAHVGFVWPLVLIAIGAVFLLQDLGTIDADVALWPIVLIAVGVGILLSALPTRRRSVGTVAEQIAIDSATAARIHLKHGAGRLSVGPSVDPDILLQGSFAGGVDKKVRRTGSEVDVTLRQPTAAGHEWAFPWNWNRGPLDWSVGLSRRVPMRLQIDSGANQTELDLSDLAVGELVVNTGASETSLTVPVKGKTAVRVKMGAASLRIRVPDRTAARIRVRGGLSSTKVDEGRFPRSGDEFRSADFDQAEDRAEIEVDAGAASVEVR